MSVAEIDFVIFWVDGEDPAHRRKREQFQQNFALQSSDNHEQSTHDLRFIQHDELRYCLRSIKCHAPWYRKIWLVVDDQFPLFLDKTKLQSERIEVVQHADIGLDANYLPTFSSRVLASAVHNLPDLSECYLLGNDDIMLGNTISPDYFFKDGAPVIYADKMAKTDIKSLTLFYRGIVNGAELVNPAIEEILIPSHGYIPFVKSVQSEIEGQYQANFEHNKQHRFRHESQFLPESLYYHYCAAHHLAHICTTERMVHFSFELCRIGTEQKIQFLMELIASGQRDMFCINEFQSLYPRVPAVKNYLEKICGPALLCET